MKTIFILITMFFADYTYQGSDAISVDTENGQPLRFATMENCFEYVDKNVEGLKAFAIANWADHNPPPLVKQILCVDESREIAGSRKGKTI